MKKIKILFSLFIALALVAACQAPNTLNATQETKLIRYQSYAGMVSLPELAADLGYLEDLQLEYVGTVQGGPQDLLTLVAGDVDIASAFNGAVVKVIAADLAIVPVVSSYGSNQMQNVGYYVLENSPIKTARDFIGKKVAVNTFGAHHDFVIKDYLAQHGLTAAEIAQVELIMLPPISSEQALRNGQVDVVVLTTILEQLAVNNGGIRRVFADTDLYGNFTAGSYSVRQDFIEKNPNTTRTIVTAISKAHTWLQTTPVEEIQARCKKIIEKRQRNETLALVPFFKGYGVDEAGGIQKAADFQPWIDLMVKENKLKPNQINAEDIFTNQYNSNLNSN